jgi:multiple sugar transport system substrate-binding protein
MSSAINSPANIATLQFLMDMFIVDGTTPSGQQNAELTAEHFFVNGQAAMGVFGSWRVSFLSEHLTDLGHTLAFVEMPIGPGGRTGVSHGIGYGTPADGANLELAWEFIKFLGTTEAQTLQAGVVIPADAAAAAAWEANFPQYDLSPFIRALSYSPPLPLAMQGIGGARQVTRDVLSEIWLQSNDIPSALANAEQRMNDEIALG